jgi:low affinity Fe/Cu permease
MRDIGLGRIATLSVIAIAVAVWIALPGLGFSLTRFG